jgi:hypothetical protein
VPGNDLGFRQAFAKVGQVEGNAHDLLARLR